jgi:hypothetical protein
MCNKALLDYNLKGSGEHIVDLPDAVAMGVVLWDDIVIESLPCYCYACTLEQAAYGQVIVDVNVKQDRLYLGRCCGDMVFQPSFQRSRKGRNPKIGTEAALEKVFIVNK